MSLRTILIAVCAFVCAGLAAVGVSRSLSRKGGQDGSASVLVVTTDVPRGVVLGAGQVASLPFPKSMLPPGALIRTEEAIGRASLGHLHKGEVLMDSKLALKGSKGGIAALIPPGMRAIAVQTPNIATGVAGFILPGNKVDVLITLSGGSRDDRDATSTMPLLENVEILAVDQKVDAPAENRIDAAQMRSVTLLVTPEQASRLNLGMSRGTLHLSLRNPTDNLLATAKPATLRDIQPEPEPPPPAAVVKPVTQELPPAPVVPPASQFLRLRLVKAGSEGEVQFHGKNLLASPPDRLVQAIDRAVVTTNPE